MPTNNLCASCRASRRLVARLLGDGGNHTADLRRKAGVRQLQAEEAARREELHRRRARVIAEMDPRGGTL